MADIVTIVTYTSHKWIDGSKFYREVPVGTADISEWPDLIMADFTEAPVPEAQSIVATINDWWFGLCQKSPEAPVVLVASAKRAYPR